jgi:hypothetical protein
MSRLEDITPGAAIKGILPDALVSAINAQWFGSEALELTYKDQLGRVGNQLLYRHDEPRLEVVAVGRPWSFDACLIPWQPRFFRCKWCMADSGHEYACMLSSEPHA